MTYGSLVSVIMAAYNSRSTIVDAVSSVLSQTYENIEFIIVDDCSHDGTFEILKELEASDERLLILHNERNKGVSYSRLRALKETNGEFVAIIDSDDIWANNKLEKQIACQLETGADVVYTGSSFIDKDGTAFSWKMDVPRKVTYKELLSRNVISNSSSMVRRDLFLKYYVSGDGMHEDFALWLSILKNGFIAVGVNEPLLIYRISYDSKSGNKFKSAIMNWRTYKYIGLGFLSRCYFMVKYTINGLKKYRNL